MVEWHLGFRDGVKVGFSLLLVTEKLETAMSVKTRFWAFGANQSIQMVIYTSHRDGLNKRAGCGLYGIVSAVVKLDFAGLLAKILGLAISRLILNLQFYYCF